MKWNNMQRLLEWICKKCAPKRDIPVAFKDGVLKLSILSLFFLLLGIFMGRVMESPRFLFWTVILSLLFFGKSIWLVHIASSGKYEMIEGTDKETKGKNAVGRLQKIRITKTDGTETELLLGKEIRVQAGMAYRFYFSRQETALSGIKTLDAALNLGSFYGLEKAGDGK